MPAEVTITTILDIVLTLQRGTLHNVLLEINCILGAARPYVGQSFESKPFKSVEYTVRNYSGKEMASQVHLIQQGNV